MFTSLALTLVPVLIFIIISSAATLTKFTRRTRRPLGALDGEDEDDNYEDDRHENQEADVNR